MAQAAARIASRPTPRRHRLWPGRALRQPPGGPTAAEPEQAPPLPAGMLTARELIAMARAARVGRQG